MKKIFTLAAAVLFATGLWAQTTLFSMEVKASGSDYKAETTELEATTSDYLAAISGGTLHVGITDGSPQKVFGSDNSEYHMRLASGKVYAKITLSDDAVFAKGDTIKFTGSSGEVAYITTEKASSSAIAFSARQYIIPASSPLIGKSVIYLWKASSNTFIKTLTIVRPAPAATHALVWDFDGGESSAVEGTDYTAAGQVAEGETLLYPANNTMAKEGFDFAGWSSEETVMPTSDLTITALWTAHVVSSDATLADLTINGTTVDGFAAATEEYYVVLPFGTTAIPTVAGTANSPYAQSVDVTPATSVNGSATVVVTAEDNSTKTYTIHFSVATSKDIELVWKTGSKRCDDSTTGSTAIKSDDASVAAFINPITFTNVEGTGDDAAEGNSLNLGKKAGNMLSLSTKSGMAIEELSFFGKIQDATCEYSLDGGDWVTLTSTNTGNDACYEIIENGAVQELRIRSTGASGVWIRNMQLTIVAHNEGPATALDNTDAAVKAEKVIREGQVLIIRDGKTFNVLGARVR